MALTERESEEAAKLRAISERMAEIELFVIDQLAAIPLALEAHYGDNLTSLVALLQAYVLGLAFALCPLLAQPDGRRILYKTLQRTAMIVEQRGSGAPAAALLRQMAAAIVPEPR